MGDERLASGGFPMRRKSYFALAALAGVTLIEAQTGTVQNAALPQSSPYALGLTGGLGYFAASPLPGNLNIVSPRMLAVLSYPLALSTIATLQAPVSPGSATVSIRPVGSSSAIPVTVTNLAAGAITFVVPAGVPLGGAELLYKIEGQPTQWTTLNVVQSSFAFFRTEMFGPAAAQSIAADGSVTNIGLTTPVRPGQTLVLTGSGLGYGSKVSATIGGVDAPVTYAGPHPTQAGHDQILIPIPAGVASGCYLPVNLTYNGITVVTTISKTDDGSPCKHPWGLSPADMATLDQGGSLADAQISLVTQFDAVTAASTSRAESAYMVLSTVDAGALAGYFALAQPRAASCNPVGLSTAIAVIRSGLFSVIGISPPPDIGSSVALQGPGGSLTLAGSGGSYFLWQAPAPVDGSPSSLPNSTIARGNWTWQSSDGKDLPASSFGFTLPAPLQLAGAAPVVFKRDQDQTVSWNASALDPSTVVSVNLNGGGVQIACSAPAAAGSLTIPAALLAGATPNSIGTLFGSVGQPGASMPHTTLKLKDGRTLLVFVSYNSSDSRPLVFQ